jgi:hypothetical protein
MCLKIRPSSLLLLQDTSIRSTFYRDERSFTEDFGSNSITMSEKINETLDKSKSQNYINGGQAYYRNRASHSKEHHRFICFNGGP